MGTRPYQPKQKRICEICGGEFLAPAHLIRRGYGRTCSRKCGATSGAIKHFKSLEERFFEKILVGDGCWEWQGAKERYGYGHMNDHGKMIKAHKLSYQMFVGPIHPRKEICHSCDNPPCVRPLHLFQGTRRDNAMDAYLKGRNIPPRFSGENHPMVKLTRQQVDEIRFLYGTGQWSHRKLGEHFSMSHSQIGKTIRRVSYL